MHLSTQLCEACKLVFQTGGGPYRNEIWTGLVCSKCGLLHELVFTHTTNERDWKTGISALFAYPKTFRTLEQLERVARVDWIKVADFQGWPSFDSLSCSHCKTQGSLVDGKGLYKDGSRRAKCPICNDALKTLRCIQFR